MMLSRTIKIPSDVRLLRRVSLEIEKALNKYKVSESLLFDIRLCVEEAVRNAIVHGNKKDKARLVRISYAIKENGINVQVLDEGGGFDAAALPDPTTNNNIYKEGGRGVFLIRKLMDEVSYNEKGSCLSMVKYFLVSK